jgi:hypothetical protein
MVYYGWFGGATREVLLRISTEAHGLYSFTGDEEEVLYREVELRVTPNIDRSADASPVYHNR